MARFHHAVPGLKLIAGVAPQLAPQRVERLAVAQHMDFETLVAGPRAQRAQIAAGSLDLGQNVGLVPPGGRIGHGGESREVEPSVPEAGLTEPAAGLERDHQQVLATGFDGLQHRPGEHRGRADAGQGNSMPRHRREPEGEHFGAGDRTEKHAFVPPATRIPPQPRRVEVARAGERAGRLAANQRATFPGEYVRDGLLAELFLHHVGDDAGDVVREPLEVARELRQALLVPVERERVEQLRSIPMVRGQSGARDHEYAPGRHQMPIAVTRS